MPYTHPVHEGKQWCIYHKNPDGSRGQRVGCSDSLEQAQAQLRALHMAMADEKTGDLLEPIIGEKVMMHDQAAPFSQSEVNYIPLSTTAGKACANCRFFRCEGVCMVVDDDPARILATGYCDEWRADIPTMIGAQVPMPVMSEGEGEDMSMGMGERVVNAMKGLFESLLRRETSLPVAGFKDVGENRWLAWYTNNFRDRDHQIFSDVAHTRYVERVQSGTLPYPELWHNHLLGTRYGKADALWKLGHFVVASGTYDDPQQNSLVAPFRQWQAKQSRVELSHGYLYPRKSLDTSGVYHDYYTYEISTLFNAPSNPFTSFIGEKRTMSVDDKTKEHLISVLGESAASDVIKQAEAFGKKLEEMGIQYKQAVDTEPQAQADKTADANQNAQIVQAINMILQSQQQAHEAQMKSLNETYANALTGLRQEVTAVKSALETLLQHEPASRSSKTLVNANDPQAKFLIQDKGLNAKGKSVVEQIVAGGLLNVDEVNRKSGDDVPPFMGAAPNGQGA